MTDIDLTAIKPTPMPTAGDMLYRYELKITFLIPDKDDTANKRDTHVATPYKKVQTTSGMFSGINASGIPFDIADQLVAVFNDDLPHPNLPVIPEQPVFYFTQYGHDEFIYQINKIRDAVNAHGQNCKFVERMYPYDPEKHVLHYYDKYQVLISDKTPGSGASESPQCKPIGKTK